MLAIQTKTQSLIFPESCFEAQIQFSLEEPFSFEEVSIKRSFYLKGQTYSSPPFRPHVLGLLGSSKKHGLIFSIILKARTRACVYWYLQNDRASVKKSSMAKFN